MISFDYASSSMISIPRYYCCTLAAAFYGYFCQARLHQVGDSMNLMKRICGALAVAGTMLLSLSAHAQSSYDWTGFYAGVQGAVATGSARSEETYCDANICGTFVGATLADSFIADYGLGGFRGGVHAGYNHQIDSVVIGVVTDLNMSRISGTGGYFYRDGVGGAPSAAPPNTSTFTFDWEGSTRLVAGVAMDEWMPYLTAGIGYGQGTLDNVRQYGTPQVNPVYSTGVTLLGVTVGAGLNYAIAENIILSGEVRHTAYGTTLVREVDGTESTTQRVSISNTAAQVGISFKF